MCECLKSNENVIPIFYACDDAFVKYTIVSLTSIIKNSSKDRVYKVYVLHAGISEMMRVQVLELENDIFKIEFVDVKKHLYLLGKNLPLRDYYSKTTYFRMFIAEIFPEYDKAIYIDSDTVVLGDLSELFDTDLKGNLVGACHEQVMLQTEVFGNYVENVLGINRNNYFNAGVLLINCALFRKERIMENFIKLLGEYNFVVTQDQDYLNVICCNKVLWLSNSWNVEVYGDIPVKEDDMKIIHYIMVSKPWHYHDCKFKKYFWQYAENTSVYKNILLEFNSYTDEQRSRDIASCDNLIKIAREETLREDRYIKLIGKNLDRIKILEKIRQYELNGEFDKDVEDDPETIVLTPNKVDYLAEKFSTRLFTKIANRKAVKYYEGEIRKGNFVIKKVNGLENYRNVKGGAIITCNHFSVYDNYAIYRAIRAELKKGQRLYKVIREGNYTSFKGLYGFFFRHCNTLPLSSNTETMKKFLRAVSVLLKREEKILIYPEQAMWWNYRKPRPMKNGAFKLAVKNNVPIIPAFITMEDTEKKDNNGFNIQAYTVWFLPAIYSKPGLSEKENTELLKAENYKVWKELYEHVYQIPLEY